MPRITEKIGASQNIGQSWGITDCSPRTWNTQRYAKKITEVKFRATDISIGQSGQWYRMYLKLWLCNTSKVPLVSATATKVWGVFSPWVSFGNWNAGGFYIRSQAWGYWNSAGQPVDGQWGSWTAELNYDNTH